MIQSLPSNTTVSVLVFGVRVKSWNEVVVPVGTLSNVSVDPQPALTVAAVPVPSPEIVAKEVNGSSKRQIEKAMRGVVNFLFI